MVRDLEYFQVPTRPDMSSLGEALKRRDEIDTTTYPITFGKYKGTPLGEVPDGYLQWVLQNAHIDPGMRHQIGRELLRRA